MSDTSSALAIDGGPPAVQLAATPWPPVEAEHGIFAHHVTALQREWADYCARRFCLAVSSGTAACHAALVGAGVGPGDEVIVPALSFSATAHAVQLAGASPVFGDIRPDTFELDAARAEALVTPHTRAIMPVHVHGLMADMDAHRALAARHDLALVEDACQAAGATFGDQPSGSFGDTAAFSLNAAKPLQAGDGGLVVCDDEDAYKAFRRLAGLGEDRPRALGPDEERGYHAHWTGTNSRLHERVAAIARAQLTQLPGYLDQARRNARLLTEGLQGIPGLIPPTIPAGRESSWAYYRIRLDPVAHGWDGSVREYRDRLIHALRAEGVARAGTWQREPLPAMAAFRRKHPQAWNPRLDDDEPLLDWDPSAFSVTLRVVDASLVIDWLHVQTEEYIRQVVTAFHKVHEHSKKVLKLPYQPLTVVPPLTLPEAATGCDASVWSVGRALLLRHGCHRRWSRRLTLPIAIVWWSGRVGRRWSAGAVTCPLHCNSARTPLSGRPRGAAARYGWPIPRTRHTPRFVRRRPEHRRATPGIRPVVLRAARALSANACAGTPHLFGGDSPSTATTTNPSPLACDARAGPESGGAQSLSRRPRGVSRYSGPCNGQRGRHAHAGPDPAVLRMRSLGVSTKAGDVTCPRNGPAVARGSAPRTTTQRCSRGAAMERTCHIARPTTDARGERHKALARGYRSR